MIKTMYISGKITGLPIEDAKYRFEQAQIYLEQRCSPKMKAMNVMKMFNDVHGWEWEDYIAADIKVLLKCNAIYMLNNWQESRGAKIEHAIAHQLQLEIFYEQ